MMPFADFCQHHGLDPDTVDALEQYTEYRNQLDVLPAASTGPAAFTVDLAVFNLWPLTIGPFHTCASQDEIAAELATLFEGLPCRLDGLDYHDDNEVPHADHLPPWMGRDTLLTLGISKALSGPDELAALPLIRHTLARNYLDRMGYTHHSEQHGVALELSPEALALGMAVNIEGALIETYGSKQGRNNAGVLYVRMLGSDGLAELGRDILAELLESVAETARAQGVPAPAYH